MILLFFSSTSLLLIFVAGIGTHQNAWGGHGVFRLVSERSCWQASQRSPEENFLQDEKSKYDCGKYLPPFDGVQSIIDSALTVLERVVRHCKEEAQIWGCSEYQRQESSRSNAERVLVSLLCCLV